MNPQHNTITIKTITNCELSLIIPSHEINNAKLALLRAQLGLNFAFSIRKYYYSQYDAR